MKPDPKKLKMFNLLITSNSDKISNISSFASTYKLDILSTKPSDLKEFVSLTRGHSIKKGVISRSKDLSKTYISVYDKSTFNSIMNIVK